VLSLPVELRESRGIVLCGRRIGELGSVRLRRSSGDEGKGIEIERTAGDHGDIERKTIENRRLLKTATNMRDGLMANYQLQQHKLGIAFGKAASTTVQRT
jgi:hypothetical protein